MPGVAWIRKLLIGVVNILFRCGHKRTTIPISNSRIKMPLHVTCLDCGKVIYKKEPRV